MSDLNLFEEMFKELMQSFIKEIGSDTKLDVKVPKVEHIAFMMHSISVKRFSPEYKIEADKLKKYLKNNHYFENDERVSVSLFVNSTTRKRRLELVLDWFALLVNEFGPLKLDGNLNRVDFGD